MNIKTNLTIQKNRLKVYSQLDVWNGIEATYYLNDKDEFEIELTNLETSSCKLRIKLNGKYISNGGLVLDPGQHYFLERHIEVDRKFEFSTYNVEDTEEIDKAIAENGLLEIEFYRESFPIEHKYCSPYTNPNVYPRPFTWEGDILTNDNTWWTDLAGEFTGISGMSAPSMYSARGTRCSNPAEPQMAMSMIEDSGEVLTTACFASAPMKETGRIKQGSHSEQKFGRSYQKFEHTPSHVVTYKLLHMSLKPITVNDLEKRYCQKCGLRRKKSTWICCPACTTRY